jgi:hypothetical protein
MALSICFGMIPSHHHKLLTTNIEKMQMIGEGGALGGLWSPEVSESILSLLKPSMFMVR